MKSIQLLLIILALIIYGCNEKTDTTSDISVNSKGQPVFQDIPYSQDYSIKYYLTEEQQQEDLSAISANRNGKIRILSSSGLLMPHNGSFYYSGELVPDISYTPLIPKKITDIKTYRKHTIYLDNKHIFSNAWAGKLQIEHGLPKAQTFAVGKDFDFLISDGEKLVYLNKAGEKLWSSSLNSIKQIKYQSANSRFIIVTSNEVAEYIPGKEITELYKGSGITCAESYGDRIAIGTTSGYLILPDKKLITKVPWPEITEIKEINGKLWFGSTWGAYRLNEDGKYSYYAGERWLPGNKVSAIEEGPDNTIFVLTDKGLGHIGTKKMTLEDKAMFFEKQVREKNIRYGFNCCVSRLPNGYSSAQMGSQASDNLWTSMYLASQLFRYKVTGSEEAKQNAYEAFEAMERLHTITGIKGLYARSFERDYITRTVKAKDWKKKELLSGSPEKLWFPGDDHSNWTWRSTVSSDQTVGQVFALTMIIELVDDQDWKDRALKYLDNMLGYIVENDLYIIDVDGEPTLWAKWNPDYVNNFPTNVGDRKLNSSNIIAFLQTAYKFTGKEKYKKKAYELMEQYGYLENLMRPIEEIGKSDADEWSEVLSKEWNHSDDEMYFLAYWGLYPYAFTPELKDQFQESIRNHWNMERPEKNALWNFIYAMTGAKEFDLDESVWFLQNYPLDLRNWGMFNSHRKDIELLPTNFRNQTTKELLPLGEVPLYRHNGDIFRLDIPGDGKALISAGDTWLLPYWMGRYLEVISAPHKNKNCVNK
jgi:hypothetical protein